MNISEARQGCCSHHGGVCGCSCCDDTPLSAKCAPYYDCSDTKSDYSSENNGQTQTVKDFQSKSSDQELSETVYFNTNTLKYHCPSCQWAVKCTQNCISVSLEEVKESGVIPCIFFNR